MFILSIGIEFEDRMGGDFLSMLNLFFLLPPFLVLYLILAYYSDIFSISKYVMRFDRFLSFFGFILNLKSIKLYLLWL